MVFLKYRRQTRKAEGSIVSEPSASSLGELFW